MTWAKAFLVHVVVTAFHVTAWDNAFFITSTLYALPDPEIGFGCAVIFGALSNTVVIRYLERNVPC